VLERLVKPQGYLILSDDGGTIFTRKELSRKFNIIFFERNMPLIKFFKKEVHYGYFKMTLLKRKK